MSLTIFFGLSLMASALLGAGLLFAGYTLGRRSNRPQPSTPEKHDCLQS